LALHGRRDLALDGQRGFRGGGLGHDIFRIEVQCAILIETNDKQNKRNLMPTAATPQAAAGVGISRQQ
jgi:hypothetical protein